MSIDRRKFLKIAGITSAGAAAGLPGKILAEEVCPDSVGDVEYEQFPRAEHPPGNVTRWAMVIDLSVCREYPGCNECITACHVTHNVPQYEERDEEIKWIWKENFDHAFPEAEHKYMTKEIHHCNTLLLCNHCDNPPCTRVCPTRATWKREKDGIVMMDWHRCIGCRYCVAACPYGSRSFNYREPREYFEERDIQPQADFPTRTRGVVEKCTFCEARLARGEWPACVLACPHDAMVFGDLDNPEDPVRKVLETKFTIRRKPGLGTQPEIYYIV